MSRTLREPLGNVSYHTDVLLKCGCIEEVRQEQRRGAVEHFYRAKPNASLGSRRWAQVPDALKNDLVAASFESFSSRLIGALTKGSFEKEGDSTFLWQPLTVDERGQHELQEILEEVDARFKMVADKSRRRLGSDEGIPLVVAVAAFKTGAG
jgi:hypothetical protein